MKIGDLRAANEARPFSPYIVHLADGREIPVGHPEVAVISPYEDILIIFKKRGGFHIVDVELITDLEINGRRPARRT